MDKTTLDSNDYLRSLPSVIRPDMERLDALITEAMKGHPKSMWEGVMWGGEQRIIGYGEYTYRRSDRRKVEWFIVGLTAQQHHLSVYVNATDDDGYLAERYSKALGNVNVGRSSITFNSIEDLDLEVLQKLVRRARAAHD
jgi:Domain of unknown function (DU1801)